MMVVVVTTRTCNHSIDGFLRAGSLLRAGEKQ